MYVGLHVKCSFLLSGFNETWIFLTDFRENPNVKFHENPVGTELFYVDGQTEGHDEADSRSS